MSRPCAAGRSSVMARVLCFWMTISVLFMAGACMAKTSSEKPMMVLELTPRPGNEPVLEWVADSKWCTGIEVNPFARPDDIARLSKSGKTIVLKMNGHPEVLKRHWSYKGAEVPDAAEVLDKYLNAIKASGGRLIWQCLIENDSAGVGHPQELLKADPKTHSQAMTLFEGHLETAMKNVNALAPDFEKWGLFGYSKTAHFYARHGVDTVIVERANDDVEDLQTGIAFCRGAARQFRRNWGVDLSLWWGPIYGCVQDLPGLFHKRNLYVSYFSGAEVYRIEGGDLFWNAGQKRLNKLAHVLDEFGEFIDKYPAGKVETPAAVMLAADHGWMTPPYWRTDNTAWDYARIPYRQGQCGIDGFFLRAFPGIEYAMQPFPFGAYDVDDPTSSPFALTCITEKFAPEPEDVYKVQPPVPFGRFKNRDQARKWMYDNDVETSPYRPMGNSRWGDIFDVITDEAAPEVLGEYKVITLAGAVKVKGQLKKRLSQYVKAGGKLVLAAGMVGPESEDLTGVKLSGQIIAGTGWQWANSQVNNEAFSYMPAELTGREVKVLAAERSGSPLAVYHRLGKGEVYTCLVPWYEANSVKKLAGPAEQLFDTVIGQVQPVFVNGPAVEWLSTRGDQWVTVVLSNNDGVKWNGSVTVRCGADADRVKGRELLTNNPVNISADDNGNYSFTTTVPAYDVRAVRIFY